MSLAITIKKHRGYSMLGGIIAVIFLLTALYLLTLALSPYTYVAYQQHIAKIDPTEQPIQQDRLVIPKIGLDISYKTGNASVLNDEAWHRFPERGDPENGGNFILAGHRFTLAPTPLETYRKSPFFGINALAKGDTILVDYHRKRYTYRITETFRVTPRQTDIEAPSTTPKLTLYSCTLAGSQDGREVIIALPSG